MRPYCTDEFQAAAELATGRPCSHIINAFPRSVRGAIFFSSEGVRYLHSAKRVSGYLPGVFSVCANAFRPQRPGVCRGVNSCSGGRCKVLSCPVQPTGTGLRYRGVDAVRTPVDRRASRRWSDTGRIPADYDPGTHGQPSGRSVRSRHSRARLSNLSGTPVITHRVCGSSGFQRPATQSGPACVLLTVYMRWEKPTIRDIFYVGLNVDNAV